MDSYITRAEHEEFRKANDTAHQALSDEDRRQNHRLDNLEERVESIQAMTAAVERLATNMEHMAAEQKEQGKRLQTLEARDGEMWRKIVAYAITAVAGAVIGFLLTQVGL